MINETVEFYARVKGWVQGVGFRHQTKQIALALALKGTVRNTSDGDVEIYVQGKQVAIEEFFSRIKNGIGKVNSIHLKRMISLNHYHDFNIIY